MGCVYLVENTTNKKCYIGKTIGTLEQRKCTHQCTSKQHNSKCFFHRALQKYGFENFEWIILYKNKSDKKLIKKEIYFIEKYKTKFPNGYNLTNGGDGISGHKQSKQTRKKMSKSAMGNSNAKGVVRSKEYLEKQRKAQTGKYHTEEAKRKMSFSQRKINHIRDQNGHFISNSRCKHLPNLW